MMEIPVNAEVHCADGLCGHSTHIVLKPRTDEVTHIVVKEKHFPHTERLVPMGMVTETTTSVIRLSCTADELARMQPFLQTDYVQVEIPHYVGGPYMMEPYYFPETEQLAVEHESIPSSELAVRRGARVEATDGHVGKVDEFLVDPKSEYITHLVLREGHLWGQKDVTIPVSEIDRIEEGTVYLKLDRKHVEALPTIPVRRRYSYLQR
jgi:sporulation protein YlmC with PRC-barrel domain